jgi:hypothetical protein
MRLAGDEIWFYDTESRVPELVRAYVVNVLHTSERGPRYLAGPYRGSAEILWAVNDDQLLTDDEIVAARRLHGV